MIGVTIVKTYWEGTFGKEYTMYTIGLSEKDCKSYVIEKELKRDFHFSCVGDFTISDTYWETTEMILNQLNLSHDSEIFFTRSVERKILELAFRQ